MESTSWRAVDLSDFLIEEFDDSAFLFCHNSGETHLLNCFPFEVLQQLGHQALTLPELSHSMAELCGTVVTQEWHNKIRDVLLSLQSLDLVKQHVL